MKTILLLLFTLFPVGAFASTGTSTLYKCVSHSDFSMHELKIVRVDSDTVRCFLDGKEHRNCEFGNAGFNGGMYLWLTGGPLAGDLDEMFCREK